MLIPFAAGSAPERLAKTVAAIAEPGPVKHITLIHEGLSETVETRAGTADELLVERNFIRSPEDALSVDPASPLIDGETVAYRPAVPVTLIVDGVPRSLRSAAPNVRELLGAERVAFDRHDKIAPGAATTLENDIVVVVRHVESWTETVRRPIAARVVKRWAFTLPPGKTKVLEPGRAGIRETSYAVTRSADRTTLRRKALISRVLRAPKARIVAEGIGEYAAFSELAQRGAEGTLRLAGAALSMIATAYTANCIGCSGTTAIGKPAGHGIVAVDPRIIPLGTRIYIPGYGHALAGDTGGAIHGHRIDLGFDSSAAAMQFGRRPITVYLIK